MLIRKLRSFIADSHAAVAFEAVIMTPILAWCFVGSFVFFDAFRTYSSSLKATYAVADVLSRETQTTYASDIQGLTDIFVHITRNPSGGSMRVSQIGWDGSNYFIDWSVGANGETFLRADDLIDTSATDDVVDQLPIMVNGERVLVIESWVPYRPYFDMGLADVDFENFTIIRPRFAGQLPFDDGTDPGCTSCNTGDGSISSSGSFTPVEIFDPDTIDTSSL